MLRECLSRCHSWLKSGANRAVADVMPRRIFSTEKPLFPKPAHRRGAIFRNAGVFIGLFIGLVSVGRAASITSTATVATNVSGWGATWSTTTLCCSDNSYAQSAANTTSTGTLSGFSFSSIPASAIIEGIQINLEESVSATSGGTNGYTQTAVSSNSGTNYSSDQRSPTTGGTYFTTTDTGYVVGGSTDTWGINWTVAGATSTFKVRIWGQSSAANKYVYVDSATVTVYYDTAAPSAVSDLTSVQSSTAPNQANLTWTAPGDDGTAGNLTGNYRIQYATYTATWSTSSTPTNATTVTVATTSAVPGTTQTTPITGLTQSTTYYFVLWSQDNASRWSSISNTTSTLMDVTAPSTSTIASASTMDQVTLSWNAAGDDGSTGSLTGTYRIQYATYTATWSTTTTPTNATTGSVAATAVTPGSAQTTAIGNLTQGTTYYFVLWTQDDGGNWSNISNTTSAVAINSFDTNQIEVAGLNSGLTTSGVAWGDFDNDGDLDILVSGKDSGGINSQLRVYKNNGNGTLNSTPIEVAGLNGGYYDSSVAWGDFDNDGDLDILVSGYKGSAQLRLYKNNGNSTFDSTPIEVDGLNGGLYEGGLAWGDFDNDGDLDILASGINSPGNLQQLRVYKNNGNGTFDPTQIEVAGLNSGLYLGGAAWGDFDNDGDLDILASGSVNSFEELRVYKNNGDSTFNSTPIEVAGSHGGLFDGGVAWGDFDNDGDLDILISGMDSSSSQLRIYKKDRKSVV